jgi:hypothetical protein
LFVSLGAELCLKVYHKMKRIDWRRRAAVQKTEPDFSGSVFRTLGVSTFL